MSLSSEADYRRAMRELSAIEGRPLSVGEARRKAELEGAIAAYSEQPGRPDRRKGRPPGKEDAN
ncbi:hypothetical protein SAMN06265365_13438 [Tistlia consotensis]|uniref:Uncharacterized protein n=1 Tax=Tistlia consotensis USBA 355 TaxID=560819 RepID=A0A1Y6CPG0_9PROT|nr:hypothetical protein [Tistlia consotensis]SMF79016.1 hypothetical protein SAMN05428998_13938 [Tistlia consotensis USBA 355]SNS15587.1 hypothetical protein SAMN06265365_13438 [Tistlia consotensis]